MIKGKTSSGFAFSIDDAVASDWEIIEGLYVLDNGDPTAIVGVLKRLIGDEQYKKLKEHLRGEDGRVNTTQMVEALKEILSASNKTKNS